MCRSGSDLTPTAEGPGRTPSEFVAPGWPPRLLSAGMIGVIPATVARDRVVAPPRGRSRNGYSCTVTCSASVAASAEHVPIQRPCTASMEPSVAGVGIGIATRAKPR